MLQAKPVLATLCQMISHGLLILFSSILIFFIVKRLGPLFQTDMTD